MSDKWQNNQAGKCNWRMAIILITLTIFALSLYGREGLRWLQEEGEGLNIRYLLSGLLVVVMAIIIGLELQRQGGRMISMALLAIITVVLILREMPRVEEMMHLVLFGPLGYAGVRAWGWPGFLYALACGFADEAIQYTLPDRVGDWADVGLNCLAASIGAGLAVKIK